MKIKLLKVDGSEHDLWTLAGKNYGTVWVDSASDIGGSCGGNGLCGKCKLRVEGDTNPVSDKGGISVAGRDVEGFRLAKVTVMFRLLKGLHSIIPGRNMRWRYHPWQDWDPGPALIEVKQFFYPGMDKETRFPAPSFENVSPQYELDLSMENLAFLSRLDRSGRPSLELRALVYPGKRVRYIGPKSCQAYGIALDIGTSTIYAALLDLQKKQTSAVISSSNLQKTYGADILARLSYALDKLKACKHCSG